MQVVYLLIGHLLLLISYQLQNAVSLILIQVSSLNLSRSRPIIYNVCSICLQGRACPTLLKSTLSTSSIHHSILAFHNTVGRVVRNHLPFWIIADTTSSGLGSRCRSYQINVLKHHIALISTQVKNVWLISNNLIGPLEIQRIAILLVIGYQTKLSHPVGSCIIISAHNILYSGIEWQSQGIIASLQNTVQYDPSVCSCNKWGSLRWRQCQIVIRHINLNVISLTLCCVVVITHLFQCQSRATQCKTRNSYGLTITFYADNGIISVSNSEVTIHTITNACNRNGCRTFYLYLTIWASEMLICIKDRCLFIEDRELTGYRSRQILVVTRLRGCNSDVWTCCLGSQHTRLWINNYSICVVRRVGHRSQARTRFCSISLQCISHLHGCLQVGIIPSQCLSKLIYSNVELSTLAFVLIGLCLRYRNSYRTCIICEESLCLRRKCKQSTLTVLCLISISNIREGSREGTLAIIVR